MLGTSHALVSAAAPLKAAARAAPPAAAGVALGGAALAYATA